MKESGESPKPKDVGRKEKKAFRNKIKALINPPSFDQMYGVSAEQVAANPAVLDELSVDFGDPFKAVTKDYIKDHKSISVWMPIPEAPALGNLHYMVHVGEIILITDQGHKIKKNRQWGIPDDENDSIFKYEETEVVFDKNGKRLLRPFANLSDDEFIRRLIAVVDTEEQMGSRIVTPARYHEVMSLLNSLTPEDEVLPPL